MSGTTPSSVHSTVTRDRPAAGTRRAASPDRGAVGRQGSEPVSSVSTQRPPSTVGRGDAASTGTRSSPRLGGERRADLGAAPRRPSPPAARPGSPARSSCTVPTRARARRRPGSGAGRRATRVPTASDVVERLPVGGERQHHRPAARTSARAATCGAPRCGPRGCRCARRRPTCRCRARRPARRPGAPATRTPSRPRRRGGPGRSGRRWPACGEQVQDAELGEHVLVPVGPGADDAGEPADTVGERAGLGVDEPGGDVVPRGVAGERRIGQPGAHPVVEPAVELDEAGRAGGRRARRAAGPLGVRRDRAAGARARRSVRRSSSAPGAGAPTPAALAAGRGRRPTAATPGGAAASGTWPLHPHDQQRQGVLARLGPARARAAPRQRGRGRPSCRTARRPEPTRSAPHGRIVGAEATRRDGTAIASAAAKPAAGVGARATTCSIVQVTRPTVTEGVSPRAPDPRTRRTGGRHARRVPLGGDEGIDGGAAGRRRAASPSRPPLCSRRVALVPESPRTGVPRCPPQRSDRLNAWESGTKLRMSGCTAR